MRTGDLDVSLMTFLGRGLASSQLRGGRRGVAMLVRYARRSGTFDRGGRLC